MGKWSPHEIDLLLFDLHIDLNVLTIKMLLFCWLWIYGLPVEYSSCSKNWSSLADSVITCVMAPNFVVELVSLCVLIGLWLIEWFVASVGTVHGGVPVVVSVTVVVVVKTATEPFSPFIFYLHALPNWAGKQHYSNGFNAHTHSLT